MSLIALSLISGTAIAVWLATQVHRRAAPGSRTFVWLLAAVGTWCGAGAFEHLSPLLDAKLAWARVQYAGIATVPGLWFMFARDYAGLPLRRGAGVAFLIWTIPALTFLAALTNQWHNALWASVTLTPSGRADYDHGWWFWIAVVYSYILMFMGTAQLLQSVRRWGAPYRAQSVALVTGALLPWAGNIAYVTDRVPIEGLDPTPLLFTASCALFTAAVFRTQLFDLVPVAREQLVDSLADAVLVVDRRRRVVDANTAARRLIRARRNDEAEPSAGGTLEELLPFLGEALFDLAVLPAPLLVNAEPEGRQYEVAVTPVRAGSDQPLAWVVLLRDVTDARRAAAERESLLRRVQEQQQRESLSLLAAGLAHHLNNLLAAIVGNADLLAVHVPRSSDVGSTVGAIVLSARRAADLVASMLAYAGQRYGASEVIDLDELARQTHELVAASSTRKFSLRYHGAPVLIFADPVQVRQLLMTVVVNAVDAVDDEAGAVTMNVGVERLTAEQLSQLHLGEEAVPGAFAYLDVCDNGAGMDDEQRRHMFTPFHARAAAGPGFGLAAVQGIVRSHHGALSVDSRRGGGTRVRVWLPAAPETIGHSEGGQGHDFGGSAV